MRGDRISGYGCSSRDGEMWLVYSYILEVALMGFDVEFEGKRRINNDF